MVYIEVKTIHGRQYQYLRKTKRLGKEMQHITMQYLGPVAPKYKRKDL